jgi:Domain of unknown function (DUF4917)
MQTFLDALGSSSVFSKKHLLIGNGFSIALRPDIFVYKKLFEQADFSSLSESAKEVFTALGTQDFEKVIRALRDSKAVLPAYSGYEENLLVKLQKDADGLRELLVKTIASSHPERPSEITEAQYLCCRNFIGVFDNVYSLNYDLLLYWAQMHNEKGEMPLSDDGFRKPVEDYEASYVTWDPRNSHGQNTWFLHGALHLFDTGTEIKKFTWSNTGVRLIEQIREALSRDHFPIFVAEGTSPEKLERIKHNDYLGKAFRSFSEISGALFIYGHSLASNDEHILKRIELGKISRVYVGIYGDAGSDSNKLIINRANSMATRRKKQTLSVEFFDAKSANVWC